MRGSIDLARFGLGFSMLGSSILGRSGWVSHPS